MITLASPAKINLFLRILRRRSDDYHELASLFQTIDLCDSLQFAFSDSDQLLCNAPEIPRGPSNLIWKALNLYRLKTGRKFYLQIKLDKQIPTQAGLGGGSSNAATTLWAVNTLLGNPVSELELQQWAAEVGSDVPFFLSEGTAYCCGRGERIRPLSPLPSQIVSIFKPQKGLSTPAVYRNLRLATLLPRCPEESLENFYGGSPTYFNDLEESALELMPALRDFKQMLVGFGFEQVLLAGSGASFVCFGKAVRDAIHFHHRSIHFQANAPFINRKENQWYALNRYSKKNCDLVF